MSQDNLVKKIIELTEEIERRKSLYDELEKLTLELKDAGFTGGEFMSENVPYTVELVDNFQDKNVQWRMAAVRRWEVKVKPVREAQATKPKKTKGGA